MNQEEKWLLEEKYKGAESEAFRAGVSLLHAGTPLAYLIGYIPFLHTKIYLDSKPLIPRSETEYWIEKAIYTMSGRQDKIKVLDLCAGSGCIGVAVAFHTQNTTIDFAEIDSAHLSTITKNLKENNIHSDRTNILISDLFNQVNAKYDFILTNPPYIDPVLDRTEESVKAYEPHQALYGGEFGMEIITKIIFQAKEHLNQSGQLWIEHEPEQSTEITKLASLAGFSHTTTFPDQYGRLRFSIIM